MPAQVAAAGEVIQQNPVGRAADARVPRLPSRVLSRRCKGSMDLTFQQVSSPNSTGAHLPRILP